MSLTAIERHPNLQLRVPHAANIIRDRFFGLIKDQYDLTPISFNMEDIPRAAAQYEHIGRSAILGKKVDFYSVEYGDPVNLPDPKEDVYQVVSPLTINAAHRAGRPTDDLLFLYGPIHDKGGRIKGVKGLARPFFQERGAFTEAIDYKDITEQFKGIQSAAAGPTRIFDNPGDLSIDEPYFASKEVSAALDIPIAEDAHKLALDYQDGGKLDSVLTARFGGVPVYEQPILIGLKNHTVERNYDRVMRPVSSPSILLALGQDALRGGYVMLGHEARNGNVEDPRRGTVIGGRSLLIPSQKMLEEPYF